jgi:CheY-like chemotaxis protein
LILLDLSMPVMTGAEAAVILKGVVPRMKIAANLLHSRPLLLHFGARQ